MITGNTKGPIAFVAVAVAVVVVAAARLAGIHVPPAIVDFALPVIMVISAAALLYNMTSAGRGTDGQDRLLHEAQALNSHAMVTLSDSEAGIFHVNERLLDATGYTADEVIGQPASLLYFSEDRHLFDDIRNGLDHGRPWSGETRLRRKNGKFMWTLTTILPRLNRKGALEGSISIRTDITAAKIASEQKDLFTLLDGLGDEVYMVDVDSLVYTYMNRAALARVGWAKHEYHGKTLTEHNPSLDEAELREKLEPLTSGAVEQLISSERIGNRPYDVRCNLIKSSDGSQRLVVVMRDTSDQEKHEQAKSELLSTISHELRTPMTSIKGAMGLLLSNAAGDMSDKARSMLSIAHRNADRLVNIVNDILDVEKIAAGQMEFDLKPAPLVNVLDEAIAANEPFASRFDVTVEKKNFLPKAIANYDFGRTLQVMTNLLSNAAKFSPPGGKIVVSMEETDDYTRISVRDFGKGIPVDIQPRIFQRFVQAPGQTRGVNGTGLGLNICQLIMKEQHGEIGFVSVEGDGTTFNVDFPRVVDVPQDTTRTLQSVN